LSQALSYDTQSLENVLKPERVLAWGMNDPLLPAVYGRHSGCASKINWSNKMVKWIEGIEFIRSEKELRKGEGGKNEDDEFFDLLPNI
jgi:sulfoxide reductase catalytic subunit YedY